MRSRRSGGGTKIALAQGGADAGVIGAGVLAAQEIRVRHHCAILQVLAPRHTERAE